MGKYRTGILLRLRVVMIKSQQRDWNKSHRLKFSASQLQILASINFRITIQRLLKKTNKHLTWLILSFEFLNSSECSSCRPQVHGGCACAFKLQWVWVLSSSCLCFYDLHSYTFWGGLALQLLFYYKPFTNLCLFFTWLGTEIKNKQKNFHKTVFPKLCIWGLKVFSHLLAEMVYFWHAISIMCI